MKKIIFAIVLTLCATVARAENEPAATSKEYVDTELATKQPIIPAESANVVMTFDSAATDGIGTKQIYDESASYASQTDALVTAATANAAVQMAINGEFYCKEWSTIVENDCWVWGIKKPTPHASGKNLFDESTAKIYRSVASIGSSTIQYFTAEDGSRPDAVTYAMAVKPNTTYTLSKQGGNRLAIGGFTTPTIPGPQDIFPDYSLQGTVLNFNNYTFTTPSDCVWIVFTLKNQNTSVSDPTNIMLEEGSAATAYEPYQNLYIPENVQ